MDTRTGNLLTEDEMNELVEKFERKPDEFESINFDFATKMQAMSGRVSLSDHRSKLGKQLTKARQQRNFHTRRR